VGKAVTYVNNTFDLFQTGSYGMTQKWNSTERTRLSNKNVEQSLLNANELFLILMLVVPDEVESDKKVQ
jgi:hypothetical protein